MEIELKKVSFTYFPKTPTSKTALKDVSMKILSNQVNAIIGKSGSGKTTLLELLDFLILPSKGKIIINNVSIDKKTNSTFLNDLRYNIGYLFQFSEQQLFESTVEKELIFALKFYRNKDINIDEVINASLEMAGLDKNILKKNPCLLSNGEKRKVAFASILARDPQLIILDEPTIGLDVKSKNSLIKVIRTLKNKYGKTIIVVSHDLDFILSIADNIFVFNQGILVESGNKYDILANKKLLNQAGLVQPNIISFENLVFEKKNIKIGYRDDIKDLIKDVYRYVK